MWLELQSVRWKERGVGGSGLEEGRRARRKDGAGGRENDRTQTRQLGGHSSGTEHTGVEWPTCRRGGEVRIRFRIRNEIE